jgi:hypothetical protein
MLTCSLSFLWTYVSFLCRSQLQLQVMQHMAVSAATNAVNSAAVASSAATMSAAAAGTAGAVAAGATVSTTVGAVSR